MRKRKEPRPESRRLREKDSVPLGLVLKGQPPWGWGLWGGTAGGRCWLWAVSAAAALSGVAYVTDLLLLPYVRKESCTKAQCGQGLTPRKSGFRASPQGGSAPAVSRANVKIPPPAPKTQWLFTFQGHIGRPWGSFPDLWGNRKQEQESERSASAQVPGSWLGRLEVLSWMFNLHADIWHICLQSLDLFIEKTCPGPRTWQPRFSISYHEYQKHETPYFFLFSN